MCGSASSFRQDFNVIYLRVVQGCNLNCTHCFTFGNRDKYKLAPLEQVESFLKSIKKQVNPKKAVMYIHGGEPFLAPLEYHRELNKIIKKIMADTEIDIIPQTNLMYQVDDEFIDFIKTEYNGQLGVSWDSKIRFESTSSGLNEDLFFKNFRKLASSNIDMAVAITVHKYLIEEDLESLIKKFDGAKSFDFEFLTYFDEKTKNLKVDNQKWSTFYSKLVKYYAENQTTWSLPLVDLFTMSVQQNKIYQCKCNCCQNRTFTMNCNGTVGLCPDETYFDPISTVDELAQNWTFFESKAMSKHATQMSRPIHDLCMSCEFYEYCGGNCEEQLLGPGDTECPMSQAALRYQFANMEIFKKKLIKTYQNLPELKER